MGDRDQSPVKSVEIREVVDRMPDGDDCIGLWLVT